MITPDLNLQTDSRYGCEDICREDKLCVAYNWSRYEKTKDDPETHNDETENYIECTYIVAPNREAVDDYWP